MDRPSYRFKETRNNSYTLAIFVRITFYAITKKQLNSHVFHSFMSWLLLHLFEVKYCPNKNDFSITKQTHVLEAQVIISTILKACHIPKKKTKQVLSNHRRNTLIICSNQSHRKILAWNVYYYYYFCTDSNQ